MFDLSRSLELIKGALLQPQPTWEAYLPESEDWKQTLGLLTIPLIIGAAVIGYVLALITFSPMLGIGLGPSWLIYQIVGSSISFALFVLIFTALAGAFRGEADYPRGLAAMSLASVPAWIGSALAWIPLIGFLLSIGLMIYTLMLVYRITPLYLGVPDGSRVGHFITAFLATVVAFVVSSFILGFGMMGQMATMGPMSDSSWNVGKFERHAGYAATAMEDVYDPPADGRLSEDQVLAYIDSMTKTKSLQAEYDTELQDMEQKASLESGEGQQDAESLTDLMAGVSGFMKFGTAEMTVVKTGGGNWAEHQWVKTQLDAARIHKDSNATNSHNYELYQRHQDALKSLH
jgi:hypothetical protein